MESLVTIASGVLMQLRQGRLPAEQAPAIGGAQISARFRIAAWLSGNHCVRCLRVAWTDVGASQARSGDAPQLTRRALGCAAARQFAQRVWPICNNGAQVVECMRASQQPRVLEFFAIPDPAPTDRISDRTKKSPLSSELSGAFHKKLRVKQSDPGEACPARLGRIGEGRLARNAVGGDVDSYGECVRRRRRRTGA
jgi:hypothetical protein